MRKVRRERIEKGSRERIEIDKRELICNLKRRNISCSAPQGTAFLPSSRLDSAVKRCSSEVLVSSRTAW